MPLKLYLRGSCQIAFHRSESNLTSGEPPKDYTFETSRYGVIVNLELLQDGKTIHGLSVINDVSSGLVQKLKTGGYDELSEDEKRLIDERIGVIRDSIRYLVSLLKQELHRFDLEDELIVSLNFEWSTDGSEWYPISQELKISATMDYLGNMAERNAKLIQNLLSENEEALVATSYLHQAKMITGGRYKWIYATIAAELAIKEILVRIEPKLEVTLRVLPSPPLNKLYGDVLESVAGIKSEHLSKFSEGAETRNRLLHNPHAAAPPHDEVNEYVDFIDDRIKWLLDEWRKIKRSRS